MSRYMISVGEDETGPMIVGHGGVPIFYSDMEEASESAKILLRGTLRETHPTWGVFVHKLFVSAFYFPIPGMPAEVDDVIIDETIIPIKEKVDHGDN